MQIFISSKFKNNLVVFVRICYKYAICLFLALSIFACSAKDTSKPLALSSPTQNAPSDINSGVEGEISSAKPEANRDSISSEIENTNILSSEPSSQEERKVDYIIGPEDLLEISVYQVDELSRTMRVSASGYIKLPLTGKIKASGLTAQELESELSNRYEKYLQEPVVSIFIKDYRSQKITVLGAVMQPKVHRVTNQNYLLDMLTMSGGLSRDAGDICYIRRGNETIVVNIDDLLIKGKTELNIPVYAADIIHFPIGGILFVDGAVRSPGSYPLKGRTTLTQAISLAKGFNSVAIPSGLKIFRDTGKEKRDVIPVDYDAIIAEKAPDILLVDKDIVIVPKSAIKEFIRSISGAVSIGEASLSGGF